jgi:hypothetical protein
VTEAPRQRDNTRFTVWMAFTGTIVAALIGGVFALIAARAKPEARPAPLPGVPPASSPSATTTAVPTPATTAGTAPAGSAPYWSGRVAVQGPGLADAVELDMRPPRAIDDTAADSDLAVSYVRDSKTDVGKPAFGRSTIARWEGDGAPERAQCLEAATAEGITKVEGVTTGDVLCLRTSEDRIVRLTVRKINAREGSVGFEATVRDRP